MALLPGSPAIGAGIVVSGVTTDQRGFPLDSPNPTSAPSRPSRAGGQYHERRHRVAGRRPEPAPGRQPGQRLDAGHRRSPSTPPSSPRPQTITLTHGQLELSDTAGPQTITGPAAGVTISGGGNSRVFQVDRRDRRALRPDHHRRLDHGGGGLFNAARPRSPTAPSAATPPTPAAAWTIATRHADAHRLHDQRQLRRSTGGGLRQPRHGHPDRLHHQRQFRRASAAACSIRGTASLTNCTLSGNFANGKNGGGYAPGGLANYARPR